MGMVGRSRREGRRLAGQWLQDAEGNLTDDPNVMSNGGALLPVGVAAKPGMVIKAQVPCGGSVMRVKMTDAGPDGIYPHEKMEVYAMGFRNQSGADASMLILFAPGAPREGYFEGLVELGKRATKPSEEELAEFYRRHDNVWV